MLFKSLSVLLLYRVDASLIMFIVSLSCISLIHVKDCMLSCKLLCATPKILSKAVVCV